jgi:protein kinase-like protein
MSDVVTRLFTALADRYRIEREIGSGGMATVYLTRDLKHDRDVALKVLRPELGAHRFLNEIKISARLDHPHILTLIDSGAADGFLYYVMPFVRGESLREKLKREKQLGLDEALDPPGKFMIVATVDIESGRFSKIGSLGGEWPGRIRWLEDGTIMFDVIETQGAWGLFTTRPGGPTQRLGALPVGDGFSVSKDGRHIAAHNYSIKNDVYMIRNFGKMLRR